MNTSYVQIRNELASEQLIEVQFQVAMSGRYKDIKCTFSGEEAQIETSWGLLYELHL